MSKYIYLPLTTYYLHHGLPAADNNLSTSSLSLLLVRSDMAYKMVAIDPGDVFVLVEDSPSETEPDVA